SATCPSPRSPAWGPAVAPSVAPSVGSGINMIGRRPRFAQSAEAGTPEGGRALPKRGSREDDGERHGPTSPDRAGRLGAVRGGAVVQWPAHDRALGPRPDGAPRRGRPRRARAADGATPRAALPDRAGLPEAGR